MGATYSLKYFFRGAIAPVICTGALHLFFLHFLVKCAKKLLFVSIFHYLSISGQ